MRFCLFDNRYVTDLKWFKQWKSYVGYEAWDHYNVGEESANPGPIDNTPIIQGINYIWLKYEYIFIKSIAITCTLMNLLVSCS